MYAQAPQIHNEARWDDSFVEQSYIRTAPGDVLWSCVAFYKWWNDIDYHLGNAGQIKPNTTDPKPGDAVLTREGEFGHMAVILEVTETKLVITEGNYIAEKQTWRVLQRDDSVIKGYYSPGM